MSSVSASRLGDPEHTSEVEICFVAETARRTRLDLEHRNIERHGPGWEGVSEGVADEGGWALYLIRYAGLFDAATAPRTDRLGGRPATASP